MTILKGLPRKMPPRLLHILARMGHGDELVLADANFPAAAIAAKTPGGLVELDSMSGVDVARDVCKLLPLDPMADPVIVMDLADEHKAAGWETPGVWAEFEAIASAAEGRAIKVAKEERFAFYERAKGAYAVVSTGETALYGNVILKKGVLGPETDDSERA